MMDGVLRVTQGVQEAWLNARLKGMVPMDINSTFNCLIRNELMQNIDTLGVDRHLIRMTASFMSERIVGLMVEGYQYITVEVETKVH